MYFAGFALIVVVVLLALVLRNDGAIACAFLGILIVLATLGASFSQSGSLGRGPAGARHR
jgi:hypothetical protein